MNPDDPQAWFIKADVLEAVAAAEFFRYFAAGILGM